MVQSSEVVRLTAQQYRQASEVLGRAFYDDPLTQYIIPDDTRRARLLPSFFGTAVHYCLRYGEVYTTPDVQGVACWLPPEDAIPTTARIIGLGLRALPLRLLPWELRRALLMENYTSAMHRSIVPARHWYLWVLGVDPPYQRRGIGSRLLRPILARADVEGMPCYLETEKERNVPFYQHHGFKVMREGKMPRSNVHVWAMLRDPGTNRAT
jgi:ribosomal protein S18 acetylase RimI-like enzyme